MNGSVFDSLCAEIRVAMPGMYGSARQVSSARAGDMARAGCALAVSVGGVEIEIRHETTAPSDLLLTVPFGQLPQENRLEACRALMDVNTLLRWNKSCAFGRTPSTGDIVLQCSLPLHDVSADEVIASIVELADIAHGWRQHRFLCPAGNSVVASLYSAHGTP
jgi:hypothetical protein